VRLPDRRVGLHVEERRNEQTNRATADQHERARRRALAVVLPAAFRRLADARIGAHQALAQTADEPVAQAPLRHLVVDHGLGTRGEDRAVAIGAAMRTSLFDRLRRAAAAAANDGIERKGMVCTNHGGPDGFRPASMMPGRNDSRGENTSAGQKSVVLTDNFVCEACFSRRSVVVSQQGSRLAYVT